MEIIKVTENSKLIRVKLGEIKPNRFRKLDRWPAEREVIEGLKAAYAQEGFWSKGVQSIINDRNEVELRFGHHRVIAATEYYGADHEVEIDLVEYRGDNSMYQAMKLENSVNRNKVKVSNELIDQSMHWLDDFVFEQYPTWNDVRRVCIFTDPELLEYFGDDASGPGNYAQCVEYGAGIRTIEKHSGCNENDIREYLKSNFTVRRKRGMEIRTQREAEKAEAKRIEEVRLKAEHDAAEKIAREEREAEEAEQKRLKAESDRVAREAKKAIDDEERLRKQEERAELEAQRREAKEKQDAEERRRKSEEDTRLAAETKARKERIQAEKNAKSVVIGEWYDSKASEVFDLPAHGKAFREEVSKDEVRQYLQTEMLVPFAKAIRERLENDAKLLSRDKDHLLTDSNIRSAVHNFFMEFKNTLKIQAKVIQDKAEKENPALELIQAIRVCITDLNRCSASLFKVDEIMHKHNFTALEGPDVYNFMDGLRKVRLNMEKFSKL